MIINHNMMAMNTHRQLGINNMAGQRSVEKLSSGYRINRAGDDAAGLAISEKMRGQIRGLNQASRNAQDGISLIQTAEGNLNEVHDILQRMRELAVQSASDTNNDADRSELQKEVAQLKSEIDRIRDTTEFNTKKLLNGDMGVTSSVDSTNAFKIDNQIIVNDDTLANDTYKLAVTAADTLSLSTNLQSSSIKSFTAAAADFAVSAAGVAAGWSFGTYTLVASGSGSTGLDLVLKDENGKVVASKDSAATTAIVTLTGAGGVKFSFAANKIQSAGEAKFTIEAKIAAADTLTLKSNNGSGSTLYSNAANETTTNGKLNLNDKMTVEFNIDSYVANDAAAVNSSISINNQAATFQIGSNEGQTTKLGIADMSTTQLGINDIDISNLTGAQSAISKINDAIERVSAERSKLGAMQNRLDHTIKNLDTSAENLQAAESRIRDVDMAKEMMAFTKNNILQQAATAMLAQANQAPQGVLQLLR